MSLVFGLIGVRLFVVQVVQGDSWAETAEDQLTSTARLIPERGTIYDRNGVRLAMTVKRDTVFADTELIDDAARYAELLAPAVGMPAGEIEALIAEGKAMDPPNRYVPLVHAADSEVSEAVRELIAAEEMEGIGLAPEPVRVYPSQGLGRSVIGATDVANAGISGIEFDYESVLKGVEGIIEFERGAGGTPRIPRTQRTDAELQNGQDLVLSLDAAIQYYAERSLLDQVAAQNAKGGMAVVMDVRSGDILASATATGRQAGGRAELGNPGFNRPVIDTFEPGSTAKVITFSAALDAGVITTDTVLDVEPTLTIGSGQYRKTYEDPWHGDTRLRPVDILSRSLNIGTMKIARLAGRPALDAMIRRYGLGQRTPLDYPFEAAGKVPTDPYESTFLGSSIGYGVSVTAQQMLDVYVAVANGGRMVAPRLVKATIADGERKNRRVQRGIQTVRPETAATLTEMLTHVVRSGTAPCAAVPGYEVAGKTGTARKLNKYGQYEAGRTMATFVGFAPAANPRLAAIVVIDEPVGQNGGLAAAPAFAEIMQYALGEMNVPPSATPPGVVPQWVDAASLADERNLSCAVPHDDALDQLLGQRFAPPAVPVPEPTDTGARKPRATAANDTVEVPAPGALNPPAAPTTDPPPTPAVTVAPIAVVPAAPLANDAAADAEAAPGARP